MTGGGATHSRPLTAHEAAIVHATPQMGWPDQTTQEATRLWRMQMVDAIRRADGSIPDTADWKEPTMDDFWRETARLGANISIFLDRLPFMASAAIILGAVGIWGLAGYGAWTLLRGLGA